MINRLIGGILMASGLLIAGLSGLCTLLLFAESPDWSSETLESLSIVAIFGGIPFLAGTGLFFAGRYVWRKGDDGNPPGNTFGG